MPKSNPSHLYGGPERLSFSSLSSTYTFPALYLALLGLLRLTQEAFSLDLLGISLLASAAFIYWRWHKK